MLCSGQTIRKFSEPTEQTEDKFHVAPSWDRGKDGKLIQMILVICCYLLLSNPGGRDFTSNLAWQCRAFSRALKDEKFKSPAIPRPRGGQGIQMTGALPNKNRGDRFF